MSKTSIEWADRTVNPLRARNLETGAVGHFCEKITPGCKNCYASEWNTRVRPNGDKLIGTGLAFDAQNASKIEHFLDTAKLAEVERRRIPTRYFWIDMTDWMGRWVRDGWIDRILATMLYTPQHTHLTLTKRHDRLLEYFSGDWYHRVFTMYRALMDTGDFTMPTGYAEQFALGRQVGSVSCGEYQRRHLDNLRLGVSVEDRERAPRFDAVAELGERGWNTMVSMEPLLEAVDIPARYLALGRRAWVIPGGESGRGARGCHIKWLRRPVDQCQAAGVPVFVKQLGAVPLNAILGPVNPVNLRAAGAIKDRKGGDPAEWPEDLRVREMPEPRA
jgi:protein gp37